MASIIGLMRCSGLVGERLVVLADRTAAPFEAARLPAADKAGCYRCRPRFRGSARNLEVLALILLVAADDVVAADRFRVVRLALQVPVASERGPHSGTGHTLSSLCCTMIRLSAQPIEGPATLPFVYTILAPRQAPFSTNFEPHVAAYLAALGVENPGPLVEQVREWREVEISVAGGKKPPTEDG